MLRVGIDDDKDSRIPRQFELNQNYPNPFNAVTTIRYGLPENAYVTIEVYDLLGRCVDVLVNEHQKAGYHMATWKAEDQTSGSYLYKIQAGDFIETKKMMLVK